MCVCVCVCVCVPKGDAPRWRYLIQAFTQCSFLDDVHSRGTETDGDASL